MSEDRPYYNRAMKALEAAHAACFKHPDLSPLGMSHGPFSGVNEALGIVAALEDTNALLVRQIKGLRAEMRRAAESSNDAVTRQHLLALLPPNEGNGR